MCWAYVSADKQWQFVKNLSKSSTKPRSRLLRESDLYGLLLSVCWSRCSLWFNLRCSPLTRQHDGRSISFVGVDLVVVVVASVSSAAGDCGLRSLGIFDHIRCDVVVEWVRTWKGSRSCLLLIKYPAKLCRSRSGQGILSSSDRSSMNFPLGCASIRNGVQ